jgi:hypothetical protein
LKGLREELHRAWTRTELAVVGVAIVEVVVLVFGLLLVAVAVRLWLGKEAKVPWRRMA